MTTLDKRLDLLELTLSGAVPYELKRVDTLIAEINSRLEKLSALPITASYDGETVLDAQTRLDKQLNELRRSRANLLEGRNEEDPSTTRLSEPMRISRPNEALLNRAVEFQSKALPTDTTELSDIVGDIFKIKFHEVDEQYQKFKEGPALSSSRHLAYTTRGHVALLSLFAGLAAEMDFRFLLGRDRRTVLKQEMLDLLEKLNQKFAKYGAEQEEFTNNLAAGIDGARGDHSTAMRLIDNMLRRLEKLEATHGMHYEGIYASGQKYTKGSVVTHDGSAWVALKESNDKPGTSDSWRLFVKKGRDGKDAPR